MCNFTTHPLRVATESDECKEHLNDLEFHANSICASKLNMLDNWDLEIVTADKVFLPNKKDKDVRFMKLIPKKLSYKDVTTDYFSPI